MTLTRPEQLHALLDMRHGAHLLAQFLTPGTASEAARTLGEAANRVSYHVRRLHALGLLELCEQQGRRRLYQVTAHDFYLGNELAQQVSTDDARAQISDFLDGLTSAYLDSVRKENRHSPDTPIVRLEAQHECEPELHVRYPAELKIRMLRLSPAGYRELSAALWQLIERAEQAEAGSPDARTCTLALLSFPGSPLPIGPDPPAQPARRRMLGAHSSHLN